MRGPDGHSYSEDFAFVHMRWMCTCRGINTDDDILEKSTVTVGQGNQPFSIESNWRSQFTDLASARHQREEYRSYDNLKPSLNTTRKHLFASGSLHKCKLLRGGLQWISIASELSTRPRLSTSSVLHLAFKKSFIKIDELNINIL